MRLRNRAATQGDGWHAVLREDTSVAKPRSADTFRAPILQQRDDRMPFLGEHRKGIDVLNFDVWTDGAKSCRNVLEQRLARQITDIHFGAAIVGHDVDLAS